MIWNWMKLRSRGKLTRSAETAESMQNAVETGVVGGAVAQELVAASQSLQGEEFTAAPIGLARVDLHGVVQIANPALTEMLGLGAEQMPDRPFSSFVYGPDSQRVSDAIEHLLSGVDSSFRGEVRLQHAHGYAFWARLHLRVQRNAQRHPEFLMFAIDDVSSQRLSRDLAALSEQRFQRVVETLPTVVWMLAPDLSRVYYVNEAFESVWGQLRETLYANPLSFLNLIHPEDLAQVVQVYSGKEHAWDVSYRILRADGEMRHVRDIGRGVFDEHGELVYFTSSNIDITNETRVREEFRDLNFRLHEANLRLTESARLDSLTACLNRGAFLEEAEKAIQIDTRYGRNSTLVFFDLNDFKQINDSFGHHVGDRALVAFAEQVRLRLRNTDELGRYGGDEFIVLLRETDAEQARALVDSLLPVVVDADDGNSLIVRYSAGIAAISDLKSTSVDEWIRMADDQMYGQKMQRKTR